MTDEELERLKAEKEFVEMKNKYLEAENQSQKNLLMLIGSFVATIFIFLLTLSIYK